MMQIVLHAGMHKTATTSVQQWLRDHQAELRAEDIAAFPLETKIVAKRQDLFDPVGLQQQLRTLDRQGVERVVFSHEAISSFSPSCYTRLRAALQPYPVRVVIAFRHWTSFLPARWKQNSVRRDGQSFGRFLQQMQAAPPRFDMAFGLILQHLKGAPGDDTMVLPFERALQAGGIVAAVLRLCGVPEHLIRHQNAGQAAAYHLNRSALTQGLNLDLERLRLVNGCYARAQGWEDSAMFTAIGRDGVAPQMFDLAPMMKPFKEQRPALWAALTEQLTATAEVTRLQPDDFVPAAARLQQAAARYADPVLLPDPSAGLFPALPEQEVHWSRLAAEDLPETLVAEVLEMTGMLTQTYGWRPSFPRGVSN